QLVAFGYTRRAKRRLAGLGEDLPGPVHVGRDAHRVRLYLAETAQESAPRNQRVSERDADVAQHGRVGEVALPARDGKLLGEMPEQRVRDAEIALGVLEVDWIDLVRHRRGADLARDRSLFQIAEGDVTPRIATEVDEDHVRGGDRIA